MVKRLHAYLICTLVAVVALPAWALTPPLAGTGTVELDIAPDPAVLNESCRLTFRATGKVGEPDFTPLEAVFDIIGRNRQTSLSWTNGQREESTSWVLTVMPRTAGRAQIPSIQFGQQSTHPRVLEIISEAPAADADVEADIALEVSAEPQTPYVQQQVIYTVRLLHRVELNSPRFSALTTSSDAIVKPLGSGRQYIEKIKDRNYDVYEQRYAIFPQKSGKVVINPLTLTTQVVTGTRSFFDPFSQSLSTRRIESEAVELTVKAVPAAFPTGATWLPARRLRLHEEWDPDVNETKVGTPLARTLFLWAEGLIAGQLPALELVAPDGIKLYPDQAQNNEQDTASGFTAVLQQKFAIIASANGGLRFPALEIPWWNVETDQLEIARLPERLLTVTGAKVTGPEPLPTIPQTSDDSVTESIMAQAVPAGDLASMNRWRGAALIGIVGWLLTLALWARSAWRKRQTTTASTADSKALSSKHAERELDRACRSDNATAARQALLNWARASGTESTALSLGALAQRFDGPLTEQIHLLERQLYGRAPSTWRGGALWAAWTSRPRSSNARGKPDEVLPALSRLVAK